MEAAAPGQRILSRDDQGQDIGGKDFLRAQVPFERLVYDVWKDDLMHVPQIQENCKAWEVRGWALLSLFESGVKTVLSAIAFVVTSIADKVFKTGWNHDAYGQGMVAHFSSFWRSGVMIAYPNAALGWAFSNNPVVAVNADSQTIAKPSIGRQLQGVDNEVVWGDTDITSATWQQKAQLIGTVLRKDNNTF